MQVLSTLPSTDIATGRSQICLPQCAQLDMSDTNNFTDAKVVQVLQIHHQLKPMPDLVEAINGSLLSSGLVTQETVPLEAILQDLQEVLQLNVIHSPHFPLILNITCLEHHDPSISW